MNITDINLITFDDRAKNNSFYASCTHSTRNKKIHWHDFYEMHLITSGTVTEYINGQKIEMDSGYIYFLKPYDIHEYYCEQPITLYKIQFLLDILDEDIQKVFMSNNYRVIMKLQEQQLDTFLPLFSKVVEEYNSKNPNNFKMIKHLMNCLAIETMRLNQSLNHDTANSDIMVLALDYIHKNYTRHITMQQVADFVGLTPNYFCSKFHKEIGQSFKQYLKTLQLNHAATLLRVTDTSISNICSESGIPSLTNFMQSFKEQYGMTPSQYRKQMKQS